MVSLEDAITRVYGQQHDYLYLRTTAASECPTALKALRLIDYELTTIRKPKGYNLIKRENKRLGFVYYVRYWHDGKMISSKWCTHTNSYDKACEFAEQNRESLIRGYMERNEGEVEKFFRSFYRKNSPLYQKESRRTVELCEIKRKLYKAVIENDFLPFLKARSIDTFNKLTVPVLDDFLDELLAKGIKSRSANDQMAALSRAFKYLARKGKIKDNPYLLLAKVPIKPDEKSTHGCYEIDTIKGIFDRNWNNKFNYLLNLIIYTTDMRPCEIRSFSKSQIIRLSGCRFIDIKKSKTESGIRLVPLHNRVYEEIMNYATGIGIEDEIPIFKNVFGYQCQKAANELGDMLLMSEKIRKEEKITFYSGRHFWKTLMNAGGLGEDVEEIFMGHKVSSNVAKLYNHRDKRGSELLVKKANEVFAILDKYIFEDIPLPGNKNTIQV